MNVKEKPFYNLKYDAVFKLIVRENREYLNKILTNILEEEVEVVEFIENELPKKNKKDKKNILDLLVRVDKGKIINVEVNSKYDEITRERNLIYYTTLYSINNQRRYPIMDKILIDLVYRTNGNKEKKETYYITAEKSRKIYSKKFKIIEVNIAAYRKKWYSKSKGNKEDDKYIVALDASKKELEELSKEDRIIKEVKEKVFTFNEDGTITRMISREEEERLMQQAREKKAKEKGIGIGIRKGLIDGRKEGLIDGRKEIIKELLKSYDIDTIHKMTKIPIFEIEKCLEK